MASRSIACLYTRHPAKDNEIAPCLLYFPYDAAKLSVSKQGMKEQIMAVKNELGWNLAKKPEAARYNDITRPPGWKDFYGKTF